MNFLAEIKPIADERGITLSQLVINWTLYRPASPTSWWGLVIHSELKRTPEQQIFSFL